MKNFFKMSMVFISLNLFLTANISVSVFSKNITEKKISEYKKNDDLKYSFNISNFIDYRLKYDFYNNENYDSIDSDRNKISDLLFFYFYTNTPNLSKDPLRITISKKYSDNRYYTNNILVNESVSKKISSYVIKNFEKLKNKKIDVKNFNSLKKDYIDLLEKEINDIRLYIKKLEELSKKKNFVINFQKDKILEKDDSLKKEDLYLKGLNSIDEEIRFEKFKISRINTDINLFKKIKYNYFEKVLKNLVFNNKKGAKKKGAEKFFNEHEESSKIKVSLVEPYLEDYEVMQPLFIKYFSNCLYETIMEDKNNGEIKKYIDYLYEKAVEKNKKLQEEFKTNNNDYIMNTNLNRKFNKQDFLNFDNEGRLYNDYSSGFSNIYIYDKNLYYLSNLKKYMESEKFKEKLIKNLNKKKLNDLKNYFIEKLECEIKANEDRKKKIKQKDMMSEKEKRFKKNIEDSEYIIEKSKEIAIPTEDIADAQEDIKKNKEKLNDTEKLKLDAENSKEWSINHKNQHIKNLKQRIEDFRNIKFEDFRTIISLFDIDKIKLKGKSGFLLAKDKIAKLDELNNQKEE